MKRGKGTSIKAVAALLLLLNGFLLYRLYKVNAEFGKTHRAAVGSGGSSIFVALASELPDIQVTDIASKEHSLKDVANRQRSLIFYMTTLDCNVCVDDVTATLNKRLEADSALRIYSIAYAPEFVDPRAYARVAQLRCPLYVDRNSALRDQLALPKTPALLLINESHRIVAAHFPHPDSLNLMHEFVNVSACYLRGR